MHTKERKSRVLFCMCSNSSIIHEEKKQEVQSILCKSGIDVTAVPDLCGMAARSDPELEPITAEGSLKIVACYPRAVRWLFHAAGLSLSGDVEIINMRTQTIDDIKKVLKKDGKISRDVSFPLVKKKGEWVPWFPVIDYDRCKNCKQCASFCLFGTYEIMDEGKVVVKNPQNCKNNCPACARICPEAAIMFPKLGESPINGDEISDEQEIRTMIKLNTDVMLGDDIYAALAKRREKAKHRLFKKTAAAQGYEERQKYIEKNP